MAKKVTGGLYESITGQLFEIGRQLRQKDGYPFDPQSLQKYLQKAIEGKFDKTEKGLLTPKPFNPAEFIGEGWTVWRGPIEGDGLKGEEDIDPRSIGLAEIDISKMLFEHCLEEGETSIIGEEKFRRLKAKQYFIRHGGEAFFAFWLDYLQNKENSALEKLYREKGVAFLDFMGLILRNPDGSRYVLYLDRGGYGRWGWNCSWLGHGWSRGDISACSVS